MANSILLPANPHLTAALTRARLRVQMGVGVPTSSPPPVIVPTSRAALAAPIETPTDEGRWFDKVSFSNLADRLDYATYIATEKLQSIASGAAAAALTGVCLGIPGYLLISATQALPQSPLRAVGLGALAAGTGCLTTTALALGVGMSGDDGSHTGLVGCLVGATATGLWVARGFGAF